MRTHLETTRLRLREFTAADVDNLYELDNDPDVMRYVGTDSVTREAVRDQILPRIIHQYRQREGFGFFAAVDRETDEFLGWFQFAPTQDGSGDIELGYRLKKTAWGRGYATEGARALLEKGFREQGVSRVVAFALEGNAASIRVMEKLGLLFEGTFDEPRHGPGARAVRYAVGREAYGRER